MKQKLKSISTALGGAVGGVALHHYGSKGLSYVEDKNEEILQEQRDTTLSNINNNLEGVGSKVDVVDSKLNTVLNLIIEKSNTIGTQQSEIQTKKESELEPFKEEIQEVIEELDSGRKSVELARNSLENSSEANISAYNQASEMLNSASSKLHTILNKINGKSNFWGESELKVLYEYLDSLTLLQELAFIHAVYIVSIFIVVWNIYSVIFANEIIKYFNIEEKYPRWNKFFNLRRKYQKYYLALNLFYFIIFSTGVLAADLLTLFVFPK